MIETRCKIVLEEIESFEFTCKRCHNTISFKESIDLDYGCKLCGNQFEKEDIEFLNIMKELSQFKKKKPSLKFTLAITSTEK